MSIIDETNHDEPRSKRPRYSPEIDKGKYVCVYIYIYIYI